MNTIFVLVNRNRKLFFRDKGMLISALITPLILMYSTEPFWPMSIRIRFGVPFRRLSLSRISSSTERWQPSWQQVFWRSAA